MINEFFEWVKIEYGYAGKIKKLPKKRCDFVLLTLKNGEVVRDFYINEYHLFDEYAIEEIVAWAYFPKPYKESKVYEKMFGVTYKKED